MARPHFLFAPGAGAPSSHPWMQHWRQRLSTIGDVAVFDYPYMQQGRRRPDPLPQLIAAHRRALIEARRGRAAILIGKSMGGRIGCHVSLEEKVEAVVCLGYPLCGGGDHSKLRDKVLRTLQTPILFVQGTRDSLCPAASSGLPRRKAGIQDTRRRPPFLRVRHGSQCVHPCSCRSGLQPFRAAPRSAPGDVLRSAAAADPAVSAPAPCRNSQRVQRPQPSKAAPSSVASTDETTARQLREQRGRVVVASNSFRFV